MTTLREAGPRGAPIVVASLFVLTLAVNLQVPLYGRYAEAAGFGQGLVALAFAAYVTGLIPVLLLLGGLAERFGNKRALLLSLAVALVASLPIWLAPGASTLLVTRVLQGVSIALGLASGTAHLSELGLAPAGVARFSGSAVALGLGGGGLFTSLTLRASPSASPLSFPVVALATSACLLGVASLADGARSRQAPLVRVPLITRQTLPFAGALFAAWSLTGIILASLPPVLARMGHAGWTGWVMLVAIAAGICVRGAAVPREPERSLRRGYALGAAATALLVAGVHTRSTLLLLGGAALSGLSSFGYTYLGGLTGTLLASTQARARGVAGYYLFGYVGFGLPCVAVAFLAERLGLELALLGYALLAGVALALTRLFVGSRSDTASAS